MPRAGDDFPSLAGPAQQQPQYDSHFTSSPEPMEPNFEAAEPIESMGHLSMSPNPNFEQFAPSHVDPTFEDLFNNIDPALTSIPGYQMGQRTIDDLNSYLQQENINDMVAAHDAGLADNHAMQAQADAQYAQAQSNVIQQQQYIPEHVSMQQIQPNGAYIFDDSQYPDPQLYPFGGTDFNDFYPQIAVPEVTPSKYNQQPASLVRRNPRRNTGFQISVNPPGVHVNPYRRGAVPRPPPPPHTPMSGAFVETASPNAPS